MSGARAEYGPWHRSWLLRGTVAAVVALLATVVGMGAANYHTISTTDDTTDAANALWRRHVSIVATTARKTRHRRVDAIRCARGGVLECAVTYEGPACDLWFLELTSSGWEAVPKLTTLWRGTHATYDEDSDAVACSSGA
jgi:hypothetical protein